MDKKSNVWAQVAYYSSMGFILPAGVTVGYMAGWVLDRWFHTAPILAAIMGFLGAGGGFIQVVSLLKRAEKRAGGNNSND